MSAVNFSFTKTAGILPASDRALLGLLEQLTPMTWIILPPVLWLAAVNLVQVAGSPLITNGIGMGLAAVGFLWAQVVQGTPGFTVQTLRDRCQTHRPVPEVIRASEVFISISPDRRPQRYDSLWFWDVGHLSLDGAELIYRGDLTQFRLPAAQIQSIHWGRRIPGWWATPSLYIDWHNPDDQTQGTWRIEFRAPRLSWVARRQTHEWFDRLNHWWHNHPQLPVPPSLLNSNRPQVYPAQMGDGLNIWIHLQRFCTSVVYIELLGITVGMLLNLDRATMPLVCWIGVVGAIAIRLPEWRSRS